jgi:hypothetical protein
LTIAICAEYDACRASATLAGKVLGTPAEEGGGGKILILERGAFDVKGPTVRSPV